MATDRIPTWAFFCCSAFAVTACMAITVSGPKTSVEGVKVCANIDPGRVLTFWRDEGVVREIRKANKVAHVEVRTGKWAAIGRRRQISIAAAAYCDVVDPYGHGSAFIEGSLQENLGSFVDGLWSR